MAYAVTFEPVATEEAQWIETRTGLALGLESHPYRSIRRVDAGMELAVKEWLI